MNIKGQDMEAVGETDCVAAELKGDGTFAEDMCASAIPHNDEVIEGWDVISGIEQEAIPKHIAVGARVWAERILLSGTLFLIGLATCMMGGES